MSLLALAVGLLASLADAKTQHCADAIVNEALVSFDDYACVTDMKSCIGAGTCLAAGIEERRLCECYLQVGRRREHAQLAAQQLHTAAACMARAACDDCVGGMARAWPVHNMARHAHEMDAAALARHIMRRGRIHTYRCSCPWPGESWRITTASLRRRATPF